MDVTLRQPEPRGEENGSGRRQRIADGADAAPLRDDVPIGIYRTTPDGRILDGNRAFAQMMGFDRREDLLTANMRNLYADPAEREAWRHRLEAEGVVRGFETLVIRRDGTRVWVRNTATVVRKDDGSVLWYEGVVEDISDRKEAEAALERRVAFERTLGRIASRFATSTDLDQAVRDGLADMASLSGASRAYLFLIRPDHEHMDNTHEWCAPGVSPQIQDLQALPVDTFAWWMRHMRAGEPIHVRDVAALPDEAEAERSILQAQDIKSILSFPVFAGGELAGFIGFDNVDRAEAWREEDLHLLGVAASILGNVLERHRAQVALRISERRFRLLVDQSPLSVQILAPNGRILRTNASWERLWGLRAEEVPNYNVLEDPHVAETGILPYLQRAFAGEAVITPSLPYTPRHGTRKGQEMWARAVIYPVKGEEGELREVVIIQEDVTEARRAEAELEASRHQLALSEKLSALGALVSGVAHEIRTPLTYVSNNVVLLERAAARAANSDASAEELVEQVRRHTLAVQEGVDRINDLVGDLRSYAKLRGGERVDSDLAEVVRGAVTLFRATHRGSVDVDAQFEPIPGVRLDREQVQQVVLNLLNNAAEAMGERGIVRVRAHAIGPRAELLVEDEGPGLAPETAARIFEPFFTTKAEGTGLGLSISKRLVESHGGTIRHEQREKGGARFVVTFPRTMPHVE